MKIGLLPGHFIDMCYESPFHVLSEQELEEVDYCYHDTSKIKKFKTKYIHSIQFSLRTCLHTNTTVTQTLRFCEVVDVYT